MPDVGPLNPIAQRGSRRAAASGDASSSTLKRLLGGPAAASTGGTHSVTAHGSSPAPSGKTLAAQLASSIPGGPWVDLSSGAKMFNDPQPIYRPMLSPGVQYSPNGLCEITALFAWNGQGQQNWGFRMWLPPTGVSLGMGASLQPITQPSYDTGTAINVAYGSLSLQFVLNRQEEIVSKASVPPDHHVMNTTQFTELGTLYDLEYLYRVCNGDPKWYPRFPSDTANRQFLEATVCQIRLGGGSSAHRTHMYQGYPNSLDVQHLMMTKDMVPMVSVCTLSFVLIVPGQNPNDISKSNPGLRDGTSAQTTG